MQARCPVDKVPGRRVPLSTVRSLIRPERQRVIGENEWSFCNLPDCDVVYFAASGETITKDGLKVRVGNKEKGPPRTVCYCFNHTVERIRDEIESTGRSTVAASIAAKVKAGECRCELLNPKGVCCLGDVNKVVKDMTALVASRRQSVALPVSREAVDEHACCEIPVPESADGPKAAPPERTRSLVAASVLAAVAASACCWLPLLLAVGGVSAVGLSASFERMRPLLLGLTSLLLGAAFYLVYFRKGRCLPGGVCEAPRPKSSHRNRVMLWIATVLVLGFAMFPQYSAYLIRMSAGAASAPVPKSSERTLSMRIGGMTCDACAARVESVLRAVPGVREATVSYSSGTATITIDAGAGLESASLVKAVENAGYDVHTIGSRSPSRETR